MEEEIYQIEERYDINKIISALEKMFPWVDKIETTTRNVSYGSSRDEKGNMKTGVEDVIRIYFYYENPVYIQKSKNGSKEIKQEIIGFLKNYFNIDIFKYGVPLDLMFFEITPQAI
jgi:hypothetical protein